MSIPNFKRIATRFTVKISLFYISQVKENEEYIHIVQKIYQPKKKKSKVLQRHRIVTSNSHMGKKDILTLRTKNVTFHLNCNQLRK
jgi:hypothetical protein